jgi:radical SAM protein with 4Fe4S-binding SPASM domain
LVISLDAYDSKGYREMRGGSKQVFKEVVGNITKLIEKRNRFDKTIKFRLNYVCTKNNYKAISNMIEFAEDLGVDQLKFDNLIPFGIIGLENQCIYEDDLEIIETIKSIEFPRRMLKIWMPVPYRREIVERKCMDPFMTIKIDGSGNIAPCARLPQRKEFGNIFLEKKIWNNKAFRLMRRTLMDESLPLPELCKTCDLMENTRSLFKSKQNSY